MLSQIGGGVAHGLTGGLGVSIGQVLNRKIKGAAQGVLPASMNISAGTAGVITNAIGSLAVTTAHALLTPAKYRRLGEYVVAGAWSETINNAIQLTPLGPLFAAFPRSTIVPRITAGGRMGAFVRALPPARMAAWPRQAGMPGNVGVSGAGF